MRYVLLVLALTSATSAFATYPLAFREPELVTTEAGRFRLSRNSNGAMAFDSDGVLHATWWEGGEVTSPFSPSYVHYASYDGAWTSPVTIDDSTIGAQHAGGRHPSLAITPDDGVWILWHDHRHTTPGGGYNDRIEIYGDFRPKYGDFSETDLRFTNANAGHVGDNSYAPMIAMHGNRVSVTWYDFAANQNASDIYLKTSDQDGVFDFSETMPAMQMTDSADRSGTPSFSFPDIAITPDGTRHLVWTSGFVAGGNIYYASAAVGATELVPQLLHSGGGDAFDPPRIVAGSNGDVWILYGDQSVSGGELVTALRKPNGASDFGAPISLAVELARQHMPNARVDSQGRLHFVSIVETNGSDVYYALFDPDFIGYQVLERITPASGPYRRPSIALDERDNPYILYEEEVSFSAGKIWFVRPEVVAFAPTWSAYE